MNKLFFLFNKYLKKDTNIVEDSNSSLIMQKRIERENERERETERDEEEGWGRGMRKKDEEEGKERKDLTIDGTFEILFQKSVNNLSPSFDLFCLLPLLIDIIPLSLLLFSFYFFIVVTFSLCCCVINNYFTHITNFSGYKKKWINLQTFPLLLGVLRNIPKKIGKKTARKIKRKFVFG